MNPRLENLVAAAAAAKVHLFLPDPTCCRSCVTTTPEQQAIIDDTEAPYIWVFRSDGSLNDYNYWDEGASGDTIGYIYHGRLTDDIKLALAAELMKRWRFVSMPANDDEVVEVGLWKGL